MKTMPTLLKAMDKVREEQHTVSFFTSKSRLVDVHTRGIAALILTWRLGEKNDKGTNRLSVHVSCQFSEYLNINMYSKKEGKFCCFEGQLPQ